MEKTICKGFVKAERVDAGALPGEAKSAAAGPDRAQ